MTRYKESMLNSTTGLSSSDERYRAAILSEQNLGGAEPGTDSEKRANEGGTISDIKKWVNPDTIKTINKRG